MKNVFKIGAIVLCIGIIVFLISLLFRGGDIETAIDRYDDGKYLSSLKLLKKLSRTADYEAGERIYYYRSRAINGLAEYLEKKYSDELKAVAFENDNVRERERNKKRLESKLAEINSEIDGDLALVPDKKNARILSRGKFYDEFVARYKGSRYIEDLDFEELLKVDRAEREKLLNAIANFYGKYPDTFYMSSVVKMIFRGLGEGSIAIKGREDLIKNLVVEYGRRYPTSAEIQRIYTCNGSDVNLRNSSGVDGGIIGKVRKDEILIQLEKSMDTIQVGEIRDYWYRVASLGGLNGWIFGKFLTPLDLASIPANTQKQTWSVEDYFKDWDDSNTPQSWMHIPDADKSSISFIVHGDSRIIKLNSTKGKRAGLFRRFASGSSFVISGRARFVAGDSFVLFANVLKNGRVYYLRIKDEEIDLSGRKIPLHTSDWHEYVLESSDGTQAKLLVDGELLLNRIPPVDSKAFQEKGIYCLYSGEDEYSVGEMEYIKIRN